MALDPALLFALVARRVPECATSVKRVLPAAAAALALVALVAVPAGTAWRTISVAGILAAFLPFAWFVMLAKADRAAFASSVRTVRALMP